MPGLNKAWAPLPKLRMDYEKAEKGSPDAGALKKKIIELNKDANLVHANPAMMTLLARFGFSADARPAILPATIAARTA